MALCTAASAGAYPHPRSGEGDRRRRWRGRGRAPLFRIVMAGLDPAIQTLRTADLRSGAPPPPSFAWAPSPAARVRIRTALRGRGERASSHPDVVRPTSPFRRHPVDVLGRVLDVAGFAVDAVLGVDDELRVGPPLGVAVDDLGDAGRAVEPGRLAIAGQVLADRDRRVGSTRWLGWSSSWLVF